MIGCPLLFSYGEDGFRPDILAADFLSGRTNKKMSTITMREFFAYKIQVIVDESPILLQSRRLFQ